MSTSHGHEGTCARCQRGTRVFPADPAWKGRVPSPLCGPCWGGYAQARAENTYYDWNDAFDNATDEEMETALSRPGH